MCVDCLQTIENDNLCMQATCTVCVIWECTDEALAITKATITMLL